MKVTYEKEVAGLRERMRKEKNAASSTASDQVSRLAGRPAAGGELTICFILSSFPAPIPLSFSSSSSSPSPLQLAQLERELEEQWRGRAERQVAQTEDRWRRKVEEVKEEQQQLQEQLKEASAKVW